MVCVCVCQGGEVCACGARGWVGEEASAPLVHVKMWVGVLRACARMCMYACACVQTPYPHGALGGPVLTVIPGAAGFGPATRGRREASLSVE